MKKYKILITNDDGLFSEGLLPLVKELKKIGEVCIVVPEKEMSAISHSLSLVMPVRVRTVRLGKYEINLVSGTPADCVRLGVIEFQKFQTDIVVSGINQGPNLGFDVNYSGTVAAAREAAFLNKTGVAISALDKNYNLIAKISKEIIKYILKNGGNERYFLNINFPKNTPKGVKITSLGERKYEDVVYKKKDPIGVPYYWLKSKLVRNLSQKESGCDISCVEKGYISITPLTYDVTNYAQISRLEDFFKKFDAFDNI